jgi:predicted dehydrogenase
MTTRKVEATDRKELGIGLLGYGFMGKCHSHAFRVIPYIYPEANILPCLLIMCGRNEERVRREAARYGFEEYSTDWQDVVQDERIDILDNCGPDPVHPEPCIAALESGKHVICEKPLAVAVDDARKMRDAANRAASKAMCVFNYRFFPAVRLAKDLIAAGRLGKVYHMGVNYAQMTGHDSSVPADQVWYSSWPFSGVLQGIGCHAIDQCRFLVGKVKSVAARIGTFNLERALPIAGHRDAVVDEATAAILEFENGAMGVMVATALATGRKNVLSWEINGAAGSLRWNLEYPNSLLACFEGEGDRSLFGFTEISVTDAEHPYVGAWWPSGHTLGWEHAHIIEKVHFLSAVASGTEMSPCIATFEDGYRVAAIIAAIRESSLSGRRVAVEFQ